MSLCYVNIYHKNFFYGGLLKVIVLYYIGIRAFAVDAPTFWKVLPSSVKSVEKTHLYYYAYPP